MGIPRQVGDECLYFCPKCDHHKQKLSVNITKGKFKCWICEYSGPRLRRLVRNHGTTAHLFEWKKFEDSVDLSDFTDELSELLEPKNERKFSYLKLPKEFISLTKKQPSLSARVPLAYLKKRNVSFDDVVFWKMGYCSKGAFEDRIIIPSFAEDGSLNYFVARAYNDAKYPSYMNPPISKNIIFNELFVDFDETIVIVEGVFDAVMAGRNAVPLLGSSLGEYSNLFQKIVKNDSRVLLALDADAEKKAYDLISKLLLYDIEVKKVNISPYKDVGSMPNEKFAIAKREAITLDRDSYVMYRALFECGN